MSKAVKTKRYQDMTADELAEATAEFDREFIADTFRPMNAKERALWERAKRKPGRPRRGKGAKAISVSIERDLLDRSDKLARKMGLSRAALIERSLRSALVIEGQE
jgi:hypothetical protein